VQKNHFKFSLNKNSILVLFFINDEYPLVKRRAFL
jgi:hypothetical protein